MSNTQQRPMYDLTASGKRMKNIRISRGFSIKDVRDYMGFSSVQSIYKWESGQCFPQADNLLALAKRYRVSPFDLLICKQVSDDQREVHSPGTDTASQEISDISAIPQEPCTADVHAETVQLPVTPSDNAFLPMASYNSRYIHQECVVPCDARSNIELFH